jgi:hypothetical protein
MSRRPFVLRIAIAVSLTGVVAMRAVDAQAECQTNGMLRIALDPIRSTV